MSSSLILCSNNKPVLDGQQKVDFIQQLAMNSLVGLDQEVAPKHFSMPNLQQKKIMITVWWSAVCLIHHSSLNPSKTITSEKYAQHWWDAPKTAMLAAGIGQRKGPNSAQYPTAGYTTNACFKSQMNWTMKYLPHLPYSPDLSPIPTDYYFSKHLDNFFRRGNASTTSRRRKIFSKSSSNLQAQMFTLQE